MKKLLLNCLIVLGGNLSAMAPKPHLLSKDALGLLEADAYKRGARTRLFHIPVLDQFNESTDKGSSNHSCVYHALRNGIACLQGMLAEKSEGTFLRTLYDREDMHQRLSYEGTWRKLIQAGRTGVFTDNVHIEELENLLDHELDKGVLANKGVNLAYFQYASQEEPKKEDFEAFNVGASLKQIKTRLDAHEDFASLIVVYVDTDDAAKPCTGCIKGTTTKQTPCCHKAAICQDCWSAHLKARNVCPFPSCKKNNPGDLEEVPRTGHYVALVLAQVNNTRHYMLMDSDSSKKNHFFTNRSINKLVEYLEGTNEPVQMLPRYIPDRDKLSPEFKQLREAFESYKKSYNDQPLLKDTPTQKKNAFSFEKKSFFGGILATLVLYTCYQYYVRYKAQKPLQGAEQVPAIP